MIEKHGDIWDAFADGNWIVITTNGAVTYIRKKNGEAVMGRGVALQAKNRFPELPERLAADLKSKGNHVFYYPDLRLIVFPVKDLWHQMAKLSLIETSCQELVDIMDRQLPGVKEVYLPRPGCGNGRLSWVDVKPVLEKYLDNRFVVCDLLGA